MPVEQPLRVRVKIMWWVPAFIMACRILVAIGIRVDLQRVARVLGRGVVVRWGYGSIGAELDTR